MYSKTADKQKNLSRIYRFVIRLARFIPSNAPRGIYTDLTETLKSIHYLRSISTSKYMIRKSDFTEEYIESLERACGARFQYNHRMKAYQFYTEMNLEDIIWSVRHITSRSILIDEGFTNDAFHRCVIMISFVEKNSEENNDKKRGKE